MDMIHEIAANMISRGEVQLVLSPEVVTSAENRCMEILERIRDIIADDTLDDPECFHRIEQIVCELERNGISCGHRHDFG